MIPSEQMQGSVGEQAREFVIESSMSGTCLARCSIDADDYISEQSSPVLVVLTFQE